MVRRLGRPMGIAIGTVAALLGCGAQQRSIPAACGLTVSGLERALAAAPSPIRLAGATPISVCVERALTDVELQALGTVLSGTADRLAVRAPREPKAAAALGYLVGATRRGAGRGNGVAAELARRIETAAALRGADPRSLAALHRGIASGQSGG